MEFKIGSFAQLDNGERCEILSALVPQVIVDQVTNKERMVMGYLVLLSDGRNCIAEPVELRHILGGRECDRVVPWASCAWRPIPGLVARLERELGYVQQRSIECRGKSA